MEILKSINLSIKLAHNTKNSVSLVNGTPFISSVVKINAKIESATQKSSYGNSSYYSKENIQLIEESCNQYLKKALNDYLYKTAKEYNCDIDGFGKYAVKYFPTIKDWQDYNWLDNFQNKYIQCKRRNNYKIWEYFFIIIKCISI